MTKRLFLSPPHLGRSEFELVQKASLKKTCRKLGISFREYLKARSKGGYDVVPYLPDLIRRRASAQSV